MLDRISMTCPNCGSAEGVICLVTDPVVTNPNLPEVKWLYLPIRATCTNCWLERAKWVHCQAMYNLLRTGLPQSLFSEVESALGLRPSQWKLWKMSDPVTKITSEKRYSRVKLALSLIMPDTYGWFNYLVVTGLLVPQELNDPSKFWRDSSRRAHWDRLKLLHGRSEWKAVWASILNSQKENLVSPDITNHLSVAMVQPLAG